MKTSEQNKTKKDLSQSRTKKDLVKMLLKNKDLKDKDETELIEMLIDSPIAIDVDKLAAEEETWKDRLADWVTDKFGSWGFIISFASLLVIWICVNIILYQIMKDTFDPYPFILLNLFLSCVAALQAPIIMMSQNRAAKKDSLRGLNDYKIDLKSELILEILHEEMRKIISNQNKILRILNDDEEDE